MRMQGGCHCGAIRYAVDGTAFHETVCYCVDCRRCSGAVSVGWFSVGRTCVEWQGTPAAYRSSATVQRRFCGTCGTTLTFEDETTPDELDVSIASLDEPDRVSPKDHVWVGRKPVWEAIGGTLPQFERGRRDG